MPIIGVELDPGNSGNEVHELHAQLLAIGAVLDAGEQNDVRFGDSTVAAVRAFREWYGLPDGDTVDLPAARLMHVASMFADTGSRADLGTAVAEAVAAGDDSQPQELYWLARYAILARDYRTALSIASRIPDHAGVMALIHPILDLPEHPLEPLPGEPPVAPPPRPPEVPYPENFYAYRRPWVDPAAVERVTSEWSSLSPQEHLQYKLDSGRQAITALRYWHEGNEHVVRRRYAAAVSAYNACQDAVVAYFDAAYFDIDIPAGDRTDRLSKLIARLYELRDNRVAFWAFLRRRRELLSLSELEERDLIQQGTGYDSALSFVLQMGNPGLSPDPQKDSRERNLDAPLAILAFVLAPLARAEANRARRQFDAALRDLRWVLDSVLVRMIPAPFPLPGEPPDPPQRVYARLACEFVELPFAKLLLAETMLDKADAEYKARIAAEPHSNPDVANYQGLKAAQTYLEIKDHFNDEGEYVARVEAGQKRLVQQIQQRLAANDTSSPAFRLLGKDILIPTLSSSSTTLPGLDRRAKAHEPLLEWSLPDGGPLPPDGQAAMRETNPRVYAALLTATARLEQLKAGFNYLGYLDTYVPPWRFQFLLERARYFADHARNAQREHLNFLGNAEREEFQEQSAAQNIEMEKGNVRIETARVDQVLLEVKAAQESADLARLHAANARKSYEDYREFDEYADRLLDTAGLGVIGSGLDLLGEVPGLGTAVDVVGDLFSGGGASRAKDRMVANAQRGLEKHNLLRAAEEANRAAGVARAQLAAAEGGLIVAGLQRQAALLRHEFAVQNLVFLRNRALSSEQWYRLVASIRSISETYLRYSVELAFLAEQAYEFEADRRINVVRFDYDLSEVGDFLAADFLVRDLDTLEQDLVVTQRQRQQQVRYVLSMAREFPEALQELRDSGRTTFSLRLEQLERRFPGLFNLRVGAVDVLPIALMDSTRFSLELTHLGTSQVRLKAQPDTPPGTPSFSPLNTDDLDVPEGGWLAELQDTWPVKLRVSGPETAVFSGLTRQDATAVFPFATTGQRHAFEALGAAGTWQLDLTARENQIVPGTLADLLVTFTLSGYHDPDLRNAIDTVRTTSATTRWLSGRTTFPDALYEFNRSGLMVWDVTRDLLTLTDVLGAVRNVAMLLLPTPGRTNRFGRVMSRCQLQLRIAADGGLKVLSEIPEVTFEPGGSANPLSVTVRASLAPDADVSWDFGDGSARQQGASQQHGYAKPGRYTVNLRVVRDGRLSEHLADVVVSQSQAGRLSPPVTAFPTLTRDETSIGIPDGHIRVVGTVHTPADDPVIANWRVGEQGGAKGNSATFDLEPGDYTLDFVAVRPLKARLYCTQRHLTDPVFDLNGLGLASNRRFDVDGNDTTGVDPNPEANALAMHLFPTDGALSPVDEWTVELPLSENAFLRSVGPTDVEHIELAEIQDIVLALEYETTPGGP